jgi:hypothetical protein
MYDKDLAAYVIPHESLVLGSLGTKYMIITTHTDIQSADTELISSLILCP